MIVKRYRNWRILSKVMTIPLVSFIIILISVEIFVIPLLENKYIEQKKNAIRQTVEIAFGILEGHARLAQAGRETPDDAKTNSIAEIKSLRYSGKEYFWINDLTKPVPKMIMHPTIPALDGKVLDDAKFNRATSMQDGDTNKVTKLVSKNLFVAFNEVVEKAGHGYVSYEWPKPKKEGGVTSELFPKESYVKLYAPWGWVIGSGMYVDDVATEAARLKWLIHGFSFLFSLLLLLLAISVGVGITRPLKAVIGQLKEMASGDADLTQRIEITRSDESGELAASFNSFLENLQKIIAKVRNSATSVAESAHELRKRSDEMAHGLETVAMDAAAVSAAGEQMASTATEIASNCMTAVDASSTTSSFAKDGTTVVQNTIAVMNQISAHVNASSTSIGSLGEKSNQIGTIIGTIEDIADQTNLLALNAAIEAARAGEQGRGFAVVADEVRALAERTTRATKEIATMIKSIQQETQGAVNVMDQSVTRVQEGTGEAAKSGEALHQILNQIEQVTDQINQIATAAEEQTATTSEISSNIDRITQQAVEECEHASNMANKADELNSLAEELISAVNQFQTIIKWNNWMSVKVPQFDEEHKKLVQMIGQLNEALKLGQGDKAIAEILASLATYCQTHFANEERLMQQHNYPNYREHKQAHDIFAKQVGEAIEAFEEKSLTPAKIMNILSEWLMDHILNVDKRYSDFFRGKRV